MQSFFYLNSMQCIFDDTIIIILIVFLRIRWRLSTILKTSNKSVWGNVFWFVKVYIFWNFIQYTINWHILRLFSLSQTPIDHRFTFNWQFLYKPKHMVHSCKTVCGIPIFVFVSFFLKLCFCSIKIMNSFNF